MVNSVGFANSSFPRVVILIGIERIDSISPSIIETFDFAVIFLLSHSDHQVVILDSPAISENNFVFIRIDLVNSDVVRLGVVFAEDLSSW